MLKVTLFCIATFKCLCVSAVVAGKEMREKRGKECRLGIPVARLDTQRASWGCSNTAEGKGSFVKLHNMCTARKFSFKALDAQYIIFESYSSLQLMQITLRGSLRVLLQDLTQFAKMGN